MYFKQIDMSGFKSFADRTQVRLEQGVTCVVGPNGCGKSNILDALRWALGEQRAKALRGGHMQDVIFNGSENRHPTGMAEVTLTFDNSDSRLPVDFAEVQVTRRVYRSGESEYLINNAPCRLADVRELFMDTGIGTNAYSLIGQGKIDMLLSSKPEDRRFIFEEAAGIIKYKSRKQVAMRKLDSAEQNLLRLNDVIGEVERQMRNLKRQVNAAIRYRELSDELRGLELRSAWLKHVMLTARIADQRKQFTESQKAYEKANAQIGANEARYEELGLRKLEVDRILHARREGVHEIDSEMEKLESQITIRRERIIFSKQQQAQAAEEQQAFEVRAAEIEGETGGTTSRSSEIQEEIKALQETLNKMQEGYEQRALEVSAADEALEAQRARAVESMNQRARTQTELETLNVGLDNIDKQLEAIYTQQNSHSQRNQSLVASLQEAQRKNTESQQQLAAIDKDREATSASESEQSQEIAKLNAEWQDLRERKSSAQARLGSLRELRDSYEGFATGVRAIMMAKQKNMPEVDGVIGPVGDLISTESAYERAIEAALGGSVNNIVVKQAESAKGAIQFLKKHQAGRVTFLPLDTIRAGSHDDMDALRGQPGVIGPAIDYVSYDSYLQTAVRYLLFNTVIVESIDDAIRITRAERRHPRLVTLDGDMVNPSGAVTGGRTKHESRGLLGRSAEISELEEKLVGFEKQITHRARRVEELASTLNGLKDRLRDLTQQYDNARRDAAKVDTELARLNADLANVTQSADALNARRDELNGERASIEERRLGAAERAGTMEGEEELLQAAIHAAQENAATARQALSRASSELSDLRVHYAGLTHTLEEAERDKIRHQREHDEALREAARHKALIAEHDASQKKLEQDIADHLERVTALSESKSDAGSKVVEAENERQILLEETEALEKALRELREASRSRQSEVHKLEISLRHDEDQMAFFQERILSEYNIALSSLKEKEVGEDEYDEKTRDALVADLRDKLQRMGTVNMMAIEEYEELEKRYEFLSAQSNDLTQAREHLLEVVDRIDVTIKAMFMETFTAIANSFREIFRTLFNGGHARIYLMDEDDPLDCGIEIEARPPGKKPQTISLLSGGEQAMTAIALLFSVFRAKPSPFCVLDEVDAPLDDANIGRFLTMLDDFIGQSQFIIITHSKQTMARADMLYGVTQQERGVSTLVSVKFDASDAGSAA